MTEKEINITRTKAVKKKPSKSDGFCSTVTTKLVCLSHQVTKSMRQKRGVVNFVPDVAEADVSLPIVG